MRDWIKFLKIMIIENNFEKIEFKCGELFQRIVPN